MFFHFLASHRHCIIHTHLKSPLEQAPADPCCGQSCCQTVDCCPMFVH
jgi:hypothetical protein